MGIHFVKKVFIIGFWISAVCARDPAKLLVPKHNQNCFIHRVRNLFIFFRQWNSMPVIVFEKKKLFRFQRSKMLSIESRTESIPWLIFCVKRFILFFYLIPLIRKGWFTHKGKYDVRRLFLSHRWSHYFEKWWPLSSRINQTKLK